jgi:hypothetical protein
MSPSLLTLSEFRAVAQSPSDAQAPRNLLPTRKITFGASIPSRQLPVEFMIWGGFSCNGLWKAVRALEIRDRLRCVHRNKQGL